MNTRKENAGSSQSDGLMLGNDVKGLLLMTHGYGARRVGQKRFLGASVEGAESHLKERKERSGVERGADV